MSGPGSWNDDRPYRRQQVDIDVNVNVRKNEVVDPELHESVKARCQHGNFAGECLICWKMEQES